MTARTISQTLSRIANDEDATRRAEASVTNRAKRYMRMGVSSIAGAIAEATGTAITARQLSIAIEAMLILDYLEEVAIGGANHQRRSVHKPRKLQRRELKM